MSLPLAWGGFGSISGESSSLGLSPQPVWPGGDFPGGGDHDRGYSASPSLGLWANYSSLLPINIEGHCSGSGSVDFDSSAARSLARAGMVFAECSSSST
jgi:hypothetical protein